MNKGFSTSIFKFLLIVVVLLSILACKENTVQPELSGSVSGKVLNADDSSPVGGVNITTNPPTSSIVSASDGTFLLSDISIGNYTITATKPGFEKKSISVAVKEASTTEAVIFLEKSTNENAAPDLPHNPQPPDGDVDQSLNLTLSWSASDPDAGDSLTFDVILYESNSLNSEKIASDIPDTSITVEDLKYDTAYFWQVIAKDSSGARTNGELWSFRTRLFPDNPLVFSSQREGNYEIYSSGISEDTTSINLLRLTDRPARDWWPRLSPNRDKIAFTSDAEVEPQIYTMDRDGSNLFKVTALGVTGFHNYGIGFCWSPNGVQLYYSHYETLYRIDADRGNLTQIATAPPNRHFREVEISPLGDRIVALTIGSQVYDGEIYLMDSDGGNMTLFVDNLPGVVESPSFSPDGNSIMFTHDVSGFQVSTGRQLDARVFIYRIDGSDSTNVSTGKPNGTNDLHPRFSPDGSKIVFANAPNDGSEPKSIWVMDVGGQSRREIIIEGDMPDWR